MNNKQFRIKPKQRLNLSKCATVVKPLYTSEEHYKELLGEQIKDLNKLQTKLYAGNRHALLIIFQAMDAAGKDSAIKHVMSGVNPQGCQVFSFKHPSPEELDHDFLWRTTRSLPERGRIGIFNRSYYEEVLIVRVHPGLLAAESVQTESLNKSQGETLWQQRYESINDTERHLHRNGTRILKFFLHLSKEEQRRRFLKRIDDPDKNWKFSMSDLREREHWNDYMHAYEQCIHATSTREAPWYVVPADDKKNARLIIADVIVQTLREMEVDYPMLDAKQRRELKQARTLLEK